MSFLGYMLDGWYICGNCATDRHRRYGWPIYSDDVMGHEALCDTCSGGREAETTQSGARWRLIHAARAGDVERVAALMTRYAISLDRARTMVFWATEDARSVVERAGRSIGTLGSAALE